MRWMKSFVIAFLVLLVGCGGINRDSAKTPDLKTDPFMGSQRQGLIGSWKANGDKGEDLKNINRNFNSSWSAIQKELNKNLSNNSDQPIAKPTNLLQPSTLAINNHQEENNSIAFGKGVKVGMLLPISGNLSHLGQSLWHAALIGVYEYTDNDNFTLLLFDTKSTPEGAIQAFNEAIAKNVSLIIGPVLSNSLKEISKLNVSQVPIISFSNNNQEALKGVYIFGYTPKQQLEPIINYALHKKKRAVAAIIPRTPYGKAILDSLSEELDKHQLPLVDLMLYSRNDQQLEEKIKDFSDYNSRRQNLAISINEAMENDDSEMIEKLEKRDTYGETPFDSVLVVAGDGVDLTKISSRLAFFDAGIKNNVQILGLQSWENFESIHREPSLVGAWYAAPPDKIRKQFEELYLKTYKQKPVRLAILSLELVLLVSLISEEILGGVDISDILQKKTGFVGIEGAYRFLNNGKVDRIMTMMRVTNRGNIVEQKPPESFQLFDLNREIFIKKVNPSDSNDENS